MSETTTETESPASETESVEQEQSTSESTTDGEKALGDAGKKALDAMKQARNEAREEARQFRAELDALKAQAEGREQEHAAEQERRQLEQEALAKANDRILKAEVRAQAAGKLQDPQDALRFMDLSSLEVGDDGEVDASAITSAITDLIQTKPYLAVQDSKRFQGDVDAGARKDARPAQLSEQDVKRLSAEGKHSEIVQARAEGRLTDYLASS